MSVRRSVRSCAIVAVVAAASVTQVSAQPASDEWHVLVAPYLMGAAMGGTTTVRGVDVDSISQHRTSSPTCSSARWVSRWRARATGDSAPT